MRRVRIKTAIVEYMNKHKSFAFGQIFDHLNKSRATNVTRTQLASLMKGTPGLRRVGGKRERKGGYEASHWEVEEE